MFELPQSKPYQLTQEDLEIAREAFHLWQPKVGDPIWMALKDLWGQKVSAGTLEERWVPGFITGLRKEYVTLRAVGWTSSEPLLRKWFEADIVLPRFPSVTEQEI